MIRTIQSRYYGDQSRWFIGIVEDIADPLRIGRVRVRIYGIHNHDTSEVPTHALPWATVAVSTTEAGIDGIGVNPGLQVGSQVWGIFADGEQSQYPMVIATVMFVESETPITNPSGNRIATNSDGSEKPIGAIVPDTSGAVGNNDTERTFNFFTSYQGGGYFKPEAAAAITGSLLFEDFKLPSQKDKDFSDYAARSNLDSTTLTTLLSFIVYELQSNPNLYGLGRLRTSTNIPDSTRMFSHRYQMIKNENQLPVIIQYARDVYNQYFLNSEGR